MFRTKDLLYRLASARQRIYQGAAPENHVIDPEPAWEWTWTRETSTLCLELVKPITGPWSEETFCTLVNELMWENSGH